MGSVSNTKKKFKLQKRAVRLIKDEHYRAHTEDLFTKLNIMAIHDRVNFRMVCTVHKALLNHIPEYIANIFECKTRTAMGNMRECAPKVLKCKLDVSI